MNTAFNIVRKYIVLSQIYVLVCVAGVPYAVSLMKADDKITAVNKTENVKTPLEDSYTVGGQDMEEYIKGVVAAEMPASFPLEALKAQAVAAYTFYMVQKDKNTDTSFDISDDYTVHQAFISLESARKKWGDGAETYENKIRSCVKAVLGERVLYNGVPATALYHAIS